MSVVLGWLIYAALGSAVVFGLPAIACRVDRQMGYWEGVKVILCTIGVALALIVLLFLLVSLGMWAGDLVSGRAAL